MSIGLDWGTSTVIASRRVPKKDDPEKLEIRTHEQRNCYLPLLKNNTVMNIIESSKINVVDLGKDDYVYAIGDDAINLANSMGKEVKRPMQAGVLQGDLRALRIMQAIANSVLKEPKEKGELVVYSVPANPIDKNMNIMHHKGMAKKALETLGWTAEPINEGLSVIYATNPTATIDGQECKFTGIGISCLCPGTKIYTDNGILNIEDVKSNDKVITHNGRFKNIQNIITKNFDGIMTKIQVSGYSNTTEDYKFVDNHELYIKRDNEWQWIGCEKVREGDIVGEPIINQYEDPKPISIEIDKYNTIKVTPEVQRFFGYFLGNGSLCVEEESIQIHFDLGKERYIDDIYQILSKIFIEEDNSYGIKHFFDKHMINKSSTSIKCYQKSLFKWFKDKFYDKKGFKQYPFDISELQYLDCLNLLNGIIRTKNYLNEDTIFSSKNTNLVILVKQLLSKTESPVNICYNNDGEWTLSVNKEDNTETLNNTIKNKTFIKDSFCCGVITKIEKEHYSGIVYDLQVEDDHSFSGPYMTIHNCGGGMINVCVAYKGLDTLSFSLANALGNNQGSSGDWIDKRLFDAYGEQLGSEARCVIYKENYTDLTKISEDIFSYAEEVSSSSNIVPGDVDWHFQVLTSLQIFYENLLDYVIDNISREFETKKPSLNGALDIVLAGGTSNPNGFEDLFKQRLERKKLPFKVGNVYKAKDPQYAVTKGCLAAAEAGYSSN